MKSYFAKLAARATLANVPVSSAANASNMSDPFEETSFSQAPALNPAAATRRHTNDDSVARASRGFDPSTEQTYRSSERVDSAPVTLDRATTPPPPPPSISTDLPAVEITLERPAPPIDRQFRSEHQELELTPTPASNQSIRPSELSSVASPTRSSNENDEASAKAATDRDERLAAIQREQAALLRKSDAFMERLIERREVPVTRHEVENDEPEERAASKRELVVERQSRLQPPAVLRVPEPVDERASLVIGRLTVEVLPPAPPPQIASPREVVIVRGPTSARSSVPSSRRFGLGQF